MISAASFSPAALARLACACEVSTLKALALPEFQQIAAYETAIARAASAEWEEKANAAIARAVLFLGTAAVTPAKAAALPAKVLDGFTGWPSKELQKLVGEAVAGIYRLSAEVIARRASRRGKYAKPLREFIAKADEGEEASVDFSASFDLKDEEAINYLANSQVFWLENHFEEDVVLAIQGAGMDILAGRDGKEAGDWLRQVTEQAFGVGAFSRKGKAYFSGVAINAATTARVTGSMFQMRTLGVSHYTFIAVDDERTTEICHHMDGKTFQVSTATSVLDEIVKAKTPEDVKDRHAWRPGDFRERLAEIGVTVNPGEDLSPKDAAAAVAAGFGFPPLHFRCRSMVDISETAEIDAPAVPPDVVAEPPRIGFQWKADQLKALAGAPDLGGVNPKATLIAPDGSRWLFKPYTHNSDREEFRAYADKLAADVAGKLDHPSAEVHVFELPKGHPGLDAAGVGSHRAAIGSIQRLATNVAGEIADTPLSALTADQLLAVQKEHALDWLISNHDGHKQNILILDDGGLLGIDKGQAFKYFGRDRLHWSYSPNAGGMFHAPYMNEQSTAYAAGKMGRRFVLKGPKENPEFFDFLKKIETMPDSEFIELVKPYTSRFAATGFKWSGSITEADFHRLILERKNGIIADFDAYYKELNGARKVALPPLPKKPKKPSAAALAEYVSPLTDDFVADIDRTGWEGKSVFLADVDKVRSGNVLVYGMDNDGTIIETYLTKDGDSALLRALGEAIPGQSARMSTSSGVFQDETEIQAEQLTTLGVKHLMLHLADLDHPAHSGIVQPAKVGILKAQIKKFKAYIAEGGEYSDLGSHYLSELRAILGTVDVEDLSSEEITELVKPAVQAAFQKKRYLKTYTRAAPDAPASVPADRFSVRNMPTSEWKARTVNGRIQWEGEEPLTDVLERSRRMGLHDDGETAPAGDSWEITPKGSKLRVIYTPYSAGAAAKTGRLRVMVDKTAKEMTPEELTAALDSLRELGISTDLAKPIDLEAEYLRKVTRVAKVDQDPAFMVPRGTPSAEVVERLGAAWSRRMGVEDVRKLKEYAPLPDMPKAAGWGHWYRFDLTEKDLEGYVLKSDLTGFAQGDPSKFFGVTLDGARAMIGTEMKARIGVLPSGMSPGADIRTGGAFRVFTRLASTRRPIAAGELRFSRRAILDADNLNFSHDRYGTTDEADFRFYHQHLDSQGLERMMNNTQGNEVCVNHTISWELFEAIGVRTERDRTELIAQLKAKGIEKFGKKKVEDVIKVAK